MAFVHWSTVPASSEGGGLWMIYALLDPRDSTVRYVGVTNRPLNVRLSGHMSSPASRGVKAWIRELVGLSSRPGIRLLSAPRDKWEDAERGWISWFRARGDLLNVDPGGICRDRNGNLIKKRKHKQDPWRMVRGSKRAKLAEVSRRQMSTRK